MRRLFEFRVFDIMKDEKNRKFLNKIKDENPKLHNRFMSLVGNKGLKIAKQKYLEFDPVEVKKKEKEKRKEEKRRKKDEAEENRINIFMQTYGDIVNDIWEYLKTSPLKSILKILREEKNLRSWEKKYKTEFKGEKSRPYDLTNKPIDSIRIFPSSYRYKSDLVFSEGYIKIEQNISKLSDKLVSNQVLFKIDFNDFEIFGYDKYEEDRNSNIDGLTPYRYVNLSELKEILEKFKYYMSDKYKEDWKIEKEGEKYNL